MGYFWRRKHLTAMPLLKERGIASVLVENPFYGLRKPKDQFRSCLRNVSDLFVMGCALILESLVLHRWIRSQLGYNPLVSHGLSMGGHMACLAASMWTKPAAIVPCLAWSSASLTFTKDVLADAIPWDLVEKQFYSSEEYRKEILQMLEVEDKAFSAGIEFAQRVAGKEKDDDEGQSSSQRSSYFDLISSYAIPQSLNLKSITDIGLLKGQILSSSSPAEKRSKEALSFMHGIMDECTHIRNYPIPLDPKMCIVVVADYDAYQPRDGVRAIPEVWPGAEMR